MRSENIAGRNIHCLNIKRPHIHIRIPFNKGVLAAMKEICILPPPGVKSGMEIRTRLKYLMNHYSTRQDGI